jgi:hypothetical protein
LIELGNSSTKRYAVVVPVKKVKPNFTIILEKCHSFLLVVFPSFTGGVTGSLVRLILSMVS